MSSSQLLLMGEGAGGAAPNYIEDVFSTYLYTGNGSTQTITNNIDLSTKGGLVWIKRRNGVYSHVLYDTSRGVNLSLSSNTTAAQVNQAPDGVSAFNTTGFSLNGNSHLDNNTTGTYASWTFRKQPKFFDVVTYTGNGAATRAISHSLASTPGFVVIKETSSADNWHAWHRSFASFSTYILLNTTGGSTTAGGTTIFKGMSSTDFTIGSDGGVNANGSTYVAYLFAHDAGGFGLTGTDNVISCGSFTTNASGIATVTLGYEPQWVLIKRTDSSSEWHMLDNMRGFSQTTDAWLRANSSAAENSTYKIATPTATGFVTDGTNIIDPSSSFIYIAIRRGPMKVPTSGTNVYAPALASSSGTYTAISNFPVDFVIEGDRTTTSKFFAGDRLRGNTTLKPNDTLAESEQAWGFDKMDGFTLPGISGNFSGYINWMMRRAPSFMDVVCYTGTGGASQSFTHNLGIAPELVIVKCRGAATAWESLGTALSASQRQLYLNRTQAGVAVASGHLGWNGTDGAYKAPTSTLVYFGGDSDVGGSGLNYVAYLFATCAGVSKVGSYTGTGTTLQIDCGFTGGARFVLIKRTDSTGAWYVWDSARGIVSGNDPYLLLNSTAAEVTSTDYIDTYSAGFEISSTAPAAINASGGTYIFLAIA